MINPAQFEEYLKERFGDVKLTSLTRIGAGVHGTGFLVAVETLEGAKSYVLKDLSSEGLGHIYPSDRAGVFLLAFNEYSKLPKHVKAIDVLSLGEDGSLRSIGGGKEYFLLMEKVEGVHYFKDLEKMREKEFLHRKDREKIGLLTDYLSNIHSVKMDSRMHYWRKLRDTIGHGECLMGVFDSYPDGVLSYDEMAEIEKLCINWRAKLKPLHKRLCMIHGDFHPGNIWFKNGDFVLLDRSRGRWGDAADDVADLSINFIFFSIKNHNIIEGAYLEAFNLFFRKYMEQSGDREILTVLAPFFAFRGAVVANPRFYPEVTEKQRNLIFSFVINVLSAGHFDPERVNDYIS